jgi:hypothetical protein
VAGSDGGIWNAAASHQASMAGGSVKRREKPRSATASRTRPEQEEFAKYSFAAAGLENSTTVPSGYNSWNGSSSAHRKPDLPSESAEGIDPAAGFSFGGPCIREHCASQPSREHVPETSHPVHVSSSPEGSAISPPWRKGDIPRRGPRKSGCPGRRFYTSFTAPRQAPHRSRRTFHRSRSPAASKVAFRRLTCALPSPRLRTVVVPIHDPALLRGKGVRGPRARRIMPRSFPKW